MHPAGHGGRDAPPYPGGSEDEGKLFGVRDLGGSWAGVRVRALAATMGRVDRAIDSLLEWERGTGGREELAP